MKANAGQIERALDAPPADIRLFLLYGPDEATSHAQAARLARAMGGDAERIDLDGPTLKADPALLADEAASISLFGGKRYIRVTGMGDESMAAVAALLDGATGGNPVVAIAGALKGTSALVKRALADKAVMACANYPLEGEKADALAMALAREQGVRLHPDAARAMAAAAGYDRAVMAREAEKLALYLDAAPDRPRDAGTTELEAIGAGEGEGELSRLVDAVLDGQPALLAAELAVLGEEGLEGIPLIRAVARRVQLLSSMAARVAAGENAGAVSESATKAVFWKEKAPIQRQFRHWQADRLATAAERLLAAERAIKGAGSAGPILAEAEFVAIARAGQRRR
jgi:DNA polymerase III subunit delta